MRHVPLTLKDRIEHNSRIKEIRYQWNAYKKNNNSLPPQELETLKLEAKKYNVELH